MNSNTGIVLASVLFGLIAFQESIRERAIARGGVAFNLLYLHYDDASPAELADRADVIVHGTIATVRPHLTHDQTHVVTDYEVEPLRVLRQRVAIGPRATPGPTKSLWVRQPGGKLVDQGLTMITDANPWPLSDQFRPGEQVVLFLIFDPGNDIFFMLSGPAGGFHVNQGRVHSMTPAIATRRGEVNPPPLTTFLSDITARIGNKQP